MEPTLPTTIPDPGAAGLPAALVNRLDHVAIAVRDIRAAVHLFHDVLGAEFLAGGIDDHHGITTIQFRFASGSKLELMAPARDDAGLVRYLDRHGEGFHHAAVMVDDLEETVAALEAAGYEVVDVGYARPDWFEAFLRPPSAFGTLIQLVQSTRDWGSFRGDVTLEEVLAGDVVWDVDATPRRREDAIGRGAATGEDAVTGTPDDGPAPTRR